MPKSKKKKNIYIKLATTVATKNLVVNLKKKKMDRSLVSQIFLLKPSNRADEKKKRKKMLLTRVCKVRAR